MIAQNKRTIIQASSQSCLPTDLPAQIPSKLAPDFRIQVSRPRRDAIHSKCRKDQERRVGVGSYRGNSLNVLFFYAHGHPPARSRTELLPPTSIAALIAPGTSAVRLLADLDTAGSSEGLLDITCIEVSIRSPTWRGYSAPQGVDLESLP